MHYTSSYLAAFFSFFFSLSPSHFINRSSQTSHLHLQSHLHILSHFSSQFFLFTFTASYPYNPQFLYILLVSAYILFYIRSTWSNERPTQLLVFFTMFRSITQYYNIFLYSHFHLITRKSSLPFHIVFLTLFFLLHSKHFKIIVESYLFIFLFPSIQSSFIFKLFFHILFVFLFPSIPNISFTSHIVL